MELLAEHRVSFQRANSGDAPELVEMPVIVREAIGGITIEGGRRRVEPVIMDCRLALSLVFFARELHSRGVVAIRHMSVIRPGARVGGTGRISGHARGLAIDVGALVLEGDERLVIEEVWSDRRRGASPCEAQGGDSQELTMLRELACQAAESGLFQVVLTPHFDRAHRNHLHFEVRPDVDWTYLR